MPKEKAKEEWKTLDGLIGLVNAYIKESYEYNNFNHL